MTDGHIFIYDIMNMVSRASTRKGVCAKEDSERVYHTHHHLAGRSTPINKYLLTPTDIPSLYQTPFGNILHHRVSDINPFSTTGTPMLRSTALYKSKTVHCLLQKLRNLNKTFHRSSPHRAS